MPATVTKGRKAKPEAKSEAKPAAGAGVGAGVEPKVSGQVWPVEDVAISKISIDPKDKRAAHSAESIEELAASMKVDRQLQIIRVRRDGKGGFIVVFGRRRFLAAKKLGWATIRAEVATLSEMDAVSQSATENIQRADITMVEESEEVCRLLELHAAAKPPLVGDVALRKVGEQLGKGETWVRDRFYLARLDGVARDLVLEGRLPLQHAREIAKLADPKEQADVAEWAARDKDGHGGRSIDYVRSKVAEKYLSLKQIPWELDKRYADKPACSTCRFNSANDAGLFEHDAKGDVPEVKDKDDGRAGVCLNARCFEMKKAHAARDIKTASNKAVKLSAKGEAVGAASLIEAGVVPTGLKAATVARAAKQQLEGSAKPAAKAPTTNAPRERSPEEKAEEKAGDLVHKLVNDLQSQVVQAAKKDPQLLVMLMLFTSTETWTTATRHWSEKNRVAAMRSPKLARFIGFLGKPDWKAAQELADDIDIKSHGIGMYGNIRGVDGWPVLQKLAKALGLELKDRPKVEDFMPAKAGAKGGDK